MTFSRANNGSGSPIGQQGGEECQLGKCESKVLTMFCVCNILADNSKKEEEKHISRNLYNEIVFYRRKEDFPVKAVNFDLFRIGGSSQNSVEG